MVWKTPQFWRKGGWLAYSLWPLSLIWYGGRCVSDCLCKKRHYPVPVVIVGSPVAGGSGKTPIALSLGSLLRGSREVFFLTRGYGGTKKGPCVVGQGSDASEVGDEALLLAKIAPTILSRDRMDGIGYAIGQGARCIISDDGWHALRLVTPAVRLLVIDADRGLSNHHLIPAGPMRDSVGYFLRQTDGIIALGPIDSWFSRYPALEEKPIFPVTFRMDFRGLDPKARYLAFAGIGYPEKFMDGLVEQGIELVDRVALADHRVYDEKDLQSLFDRAKAHAARLVTTEKDAVKIPEHWRRKIDIVPLIVEWEDAHVFSRWLDQQIEGKTG